MRGGSDGPPVLIDPAVEDAARLAFDAYCAARSAAYGASVGRMYEENGSWPSFVEIGRACVEAGWSPSEYVDALFSELSSNGGVVLPANLATRSARGFFERRKKGQELPYASLWAAAERTVTDLVLGGATEKQALMNPMISMPAWFRVFYPEDLDPDIVATFGERAKSELSSTLEEFIATKNKNALDTFKGLWQTADPHSDDTPC